MYIHWYAKNILTDEIFSQVYWRKCFPPRCEPNWFPQSPWSFWYWISVLVKASMFFSTQVKLFVFPVLNKDSFTGVNLAILYMFFRLRRSCSTVYSFIIRNLNGYRVLKNTCLGFPILLDCFPDLLQKKQLLLLTQPYFGGSSCCNREINKNLLLRLKVKGVSHWVHADILHMRLAYLSLNCRHFVESVFTRLVSNLFQVYEGGQYADYVGLCCVVCLVSTGKRIEIKDYLGF